MGINIYEDNRVEFDDSHQHRVDTSLDRNMSFSRRHGTDYYFIFRRLKSPSGEDGDGNPLMYALKEMKGYRIDADCKERLMDRARTIIDNGKANLQADMIIPVTSSYPFCSEFAGVLGDCLGIPVTEADFVSKKTVSQALEEAEQPGTIKNRYERGLYKAQLKSWRSLPPNTQVTMKHVHKKIRKHFSHLEAFFVPEELMGKSVLVVDDLLASGNSMHRTITLLQAAEVQVASGVCFLSGL